MITLPQNGRWTQPNSSDKFGSLWYTKNVNFDEDGYLKLSSRTFSVFSGITDGDLGLPVNFGRVTQGTFAVVTTVAPFNATITTSSISIAEDSSSSNPNTSSDSSGVFWQNRYYESTSTTVSYLVGTTWTASVITSLTPDRMHDLEVFRNRNTLCVTNGNEVKQYSTTHTTTDSLGNPIAQLTIPSDFEAIQLAYNNNRMGIITRLGDGSSGQNADAYFFVWDGSSNSANAGVPIGADAAVAIVAYKNSWVILSRTGQLLYFNGVGFDQLSAFPFYYQDYIQGEFLNRSMFGKCMIVEGDNIFINLHSDLRGVGKRNEEYVQNNPDGIWCFDPKVGLYHRYSGSTSPVVIYDLANTTINVSTNEITIGADIPTGTPIMYTSRQTAVVGGLKLGHVYYAIRISATVIKLATSKTNALAGTAIDITSDGTGNSRFLVATVYDYGTSVNDNTGGISLMGMQTFIYDHILFGGVYDIPTSTDNESYICMTVPEFHNIGYAISPKISTANVIDTWQKVYIKHKPIEVDEYIKIKYRYKDLINFPISLPNDAGISTAVPNNIASWTSTTVFTSEADLSDIKTRFDAGDEIELEIISGAGAGQSSKLSNITVSSGLYTVTLSETLEGTASGRYSKVIFSHWIEAGTITSNSVNNDYGFAEIPIDVKSKFIQVKIEMKGSKVAIEEVQFINKTFKPSV